MLLHPSVGFAARAVAAELLRRARGDVAFLQRTFTAQASTFWQRGTEAPPAHLRNH